MIYLYPYFFSWGRKRKVAFLMKTAQCSVQEALRAHSKFVRRFNNGKLFFTTVTAMQVTQHSTVASLEGRLKGFWPPRNLEVPFRKENRKRNRQFALLPPGFQSLTTAPQYISPIITHTYCGPMCRWPFKAGRWCSLNFTNVT